MVNTAVNLSGLKLDNPVIPASGTFGYGREFAELFDLNVLGSISVKGTTPEPRYGNDLPRIAECPSGMLNSVGLQNPGIDEVVATELPYLATVFKKPIVANVSGFSVDDYVCCAEKLRGIENVGILEINVSCPNVRHGGMSFGTDVDSIKNVVSAVKRVADKPVYVKLTPNVTDIKVTARAAEDAGADGLCLINTLLGMRINLKTGKPILANRYGGLSGPAVLPVALRMVNEVYGAVSVPIIGMGGIATAEDVLEMMMAGATAVEVGAQNLVNPYACRDIVRDLPKVMKEYKIDSLSDIIGIVNRR